MAIALTSFFSCCATLLGSHNDYVVLHGTFAKPSSSNVSIPSFMTSLSLGVALPKA